MHIVLVYRYYNDGIVYYNLTFCAIKSLMTDLGLKTSSGGLQPPQHQVEYYQTGCYGGQRPPLLKFIKMFHLVLRRPETSATFLYRSCSVSQRSASSAALQPEPAATIA